ncbi:hypothetical protein HYPBUDRAFT_163037 [Hyphopichia burtonii NRRL Y-1933]|uniref:LicD/FKTN/FKRP nucleotidyltransferase domain-containing protein n=1 Tax=Hyphopichia burtonii NRRL Y-1933 TaxID=984485 RepID=A0A1E4RE82_9ASCO|nr:hypothetical protein HYPBUDRAFT_163037 [Hyphopichia burtonii NRRL Y-1933]ODV65425.1 hypothetical protein HYPBUDRAFT_163037 [Hyphopichia burtonii NRRL Y-1933]
MINTRFVKIFFVIILVINVLYFTRIYTIEETKLKQAAINHVSSITYFTDDQITIPQGKKYEELSNKEKVAYLLENVGKDGSNYWLANTNLLEPNLKINPADFLPSSNENQETWATKSTLYYDPRFTISVYLNEIKHQLMTQNPQNDKALNSKIVVPFSWSDWVDLTLLNEELSKPIDDRANCEWLQSKINKPTKYPNFCHNLKDLSEVEMDKIGFKDKKYLPGFVVESSPMNKAPHKQVMMQGKSHLLTYQENPLSLIFLTKLGTYEAQISDKQRIVHTEMFEHYLERKNINANHLEDINNEIILNPVDEFNDLLKTIHPRPLDLNDDIYKMNLITRQKDINASRELYLDTEAFNYQQEQIDEQIRDYEIRLNKLEELMTNELHYDPKEIEINALNRHELNHYNGLKYSNSISINDEPTYYKLATLIKDSTNQDAGWHNEWRFFNGALRYLKDGYSMKHLEIREQIILDRLLRNWFRFAEEKGIISWIAHGPLLSWYWDGLMFPFDIDIDIQMPSAELNRLSANYNMTLVIEDISEGYGKYLIDCSSFLHHRDKARQDNVIDARFIDIDTGTYIDITGLGKNNEKPPDEFDSYIRNKNSQGEPIELYMDRRKHWLNFEKINPLRYSMLGGVPLYIPNDVMSMLNHEYTQGTTLYYFDGYYYVPSIRLWIQQEKLTFLFDEKDYKDGNEINVDKFTQLVKTMNDDLKVKLLESDKDILIEYYLTHHYTSLHEIEKKLMLDPSLQHLILDLKHNTDYHQLTSKFKMGKPLRKPLFDYEYIERLRHDEHNPVPEPQTETENQNDNQSNNDTNDNKNDNKDNQDNKDNIKEDNKNENKN